MEIKALIFDFDGLIIDTEWPEYLAWVEVFGEYDANLPIEAYARCLGASYQAFHPVDYLVEQIGRPVNKAEVIRRHHARADELMSTLPVLPGVEEYLHTARQRGLKLAIASSSSYNWVATKLEEKGLLPLFDLLCTKDDVAKVKPDPTLYTMAVERLGVTPQEAVAFEDSPNGITAAKAAGLFCVAVPSGVSRHLNVDHADLVVESLASFPLDALLAHLDGHPTGG